MAAPTQDKSLIASSEFDPNGFIKGIDAMTASLQKLSAQEDALNADLAQTNAALKVNRTELKATQEQIAALDKTSNTYSTDLKRLTDQQAALQASNKASRETLAQQKQSLTDINAAANQYKNALTGLNAVSKQVASENKGRSLFDVASMNHQIQQVTQLGSKLKDVFKGKIDTKALDDLEAKLASTDDEMKQLAEVIQFTKGQIDKLDPNSQEFADLNKIIEVGEQVLTEYGNTLDNTGKKSLSLRGQLKAMREELARLEDAGQDGTQEFQDLQVAAGKLQDQIGDTAQRIKVLASDTKNIDFGIGAIRGVASAFGVAEGAAALFGLKNEDVQKSIQRLNSIMLILNGLQEIQNLLQKQSVVYIVGQNIATKAYAASQAILAATLGTTAAASRALNLALIGTGIGVFLVAIGLVVAALKKWTEASEEQIKAQKLLNAGMETSIELTGLMVDAIEDAGKKIVAEAQLRQEANKQIGLTDREALLARQQNSEEIRKLEAQNLAEQLDESRRRERAERADFDRASDLRRDMLEGRREFNEALFDELNKTIEQFTKLQERGYAIEGQLELRRVNDQRERQKELNEIREFDYNQLQNYLKRVQDLRDEFNSSQNSVRRQDAAQIAKQSADALRQNIRDVQADVKKGVLTPGQGNVIKQLLRQINAVDLAKDLKEFNKRSADAVRSLEEQITSIRLEASAARLQLIRDDLEQEAASIELNYQKEVESLTNARTQALAGIADTFLEGLISEDQATENANQITEIYDQMFSDLAIKQSRAQEELAARIFQTLQEETSRTFREQGVIASEAITPEIQKLTQRFLTGSINYEKYQRELTRINQVESNKRIQQAIKENEALLAGVLARQAIEQDPERLRGLQDEEIRLRETIDALNRQLAASDAQGQKADQDARNQRLGELASYAQAIGGIVSQVVSFWQAANEAEQRSLERSISLQEKRVEAATRLAERGNAEYLRLEEDRLNELQVKQENAARRQLAINAVLQTSQALTAFVTALAQGIATGGPLGGIAIAAAVIGLIASGYAIIQGLQRDNTQSFAEGTKAVKRNGHPAGTDTVPAMLNEGEAVIPTSTNKQYADAVGAIYDKTVPAEDMNRFVNSYRVNRRTLPRLNHDRIEEASNTVVTFDGQLLAATERQNAQLEENNQLMRRMNKTLGAMGINVNVDKNGLAISVLNAVEEHKIGKKA
jgi:hypothetical protein